MLDFEKSLFDDFVKGIENFDWKLNENLNSENINHVNKEFPVKNYEEQEEKLITFKEDVDELVNFDGEKIGPFKRGQTASIPWNIAKILLDSGKVEVAE